MKKIIALCICALLLINLCGCSLIPFLLFESVKEEGRTEDRREETLQVEEETDADGAFENILDEEFKDTLEGDLMTMHSLLTDPEARGLTRAEADYGDLSEEGHKELSDSLNEFLKKLNSVDRDSLLEKNKLKYDFLKMYAQNNIYLADNPQFDVLLDSTYGISTNLPQTLADYEFYCERDIEDYFGFLEEVPSALEESYEFENAKDYEYKMCGFAIEDTVEQIDVFLKGKGDILISSFDERIKEADFITEEKKAEYIEKNNKVVGSTVIPAFERLKNDLSAMSTGGRDKGLAQIEGGEKYYGELLKSMTYSQKSPEDMLEMISDRYSLLLNAATELYTEDNNIDEKMSAVANRLSAGDIIRQLEEKSSDSFPDLSDINFEAQEIPKALRKENVLAYYVLAPIDATSDNNIYYSPETGGDAQFFITLAHEGYPGHMYQWNYLIENGEKPLLLALNHTGFMEGWAMYAENCALRYMDYGNVDAKTGEKYYSVTTELNYLLCTLADLLVNYRGYSQEQLEEAFESLGYGNEYADEMYKSSVETPGLYPRYYISYLELETLREKAEAELDGKFDENEFNKLVLDSGICYYSQLEEIVDEYIDNN